MNQIKIGHYEMDAGLVYLPIGFIPDFLEAWDMATSTNALHYLWFKEFENHEAIDGILYAAAGTNAEIAAGSGFAAYDSGAIAPTITEWAATTNYALITSNAALCYVHPTVGADDEDGNIADRDAIFQVTADAGSSGATEPAWPVEVGGTVVDDGITWTKVNKATFYKGYQGVRIAAALNNNGQEMFYIAIQGDGGSRDLGDADGWEGGIYA